MKYRVEFVGDVGLGWFRRHDRISDADYMRVYSLSIGEVIALDFSGLRPARVERIS